MRIWEPETLGRSKGRPFDSKGISRQSPWVSRTLLSVPADFFLFNTANLLGSILKVNMVEKDKQSGVLGV